MSLKSYYCCCFLMLMLWHYIVSSISFCKKSTTAGLEISHISTDIASTSSENSTSTYSPEVTNYGSLSIPDFSSGMRNALLNGKSGDVWSQMLDELVTFYTRNYPNRLNSTEDYKILGKMLYKACPSTGNFG